MPPSTTATRTRASTGSGRDRWLSGLLLRRLWLPRAVYEALPYLYMLLGLGALAAALYSPDWTWILPYVALLGLACLHAGLGLVAMRYRFRRRQAPPDPPD